MFNKMKWSALIFSGILSVVSFGAVANNLYDDGMKHYEKLYAEGDPEAAYKLGMAHYYGISGVVTPAKNKAVQYLTFAESKGHVRASTILGIHYYESNMMSKASNHFKKAAIKGEQLSMTYLAKTIEKSRPDEAVRLYKLGLAGKSPKSYLFYGTYLIKNSKKGSVDFLTGYALLINLKNSGRDKELEVDRFFNLNPYKFTSKEAVTLRQLIKRYKM